MNAEIPTSLVTRAAANVEATSAFPRSGRQSFPDGVVRDTALRSTLLGEYASLVLLAHSLFGAVYWSLYVLKNPASLVMVLAGFWIAFRAVGGFAGEKWAAGVSALMLIMTGVLGITGVAKVPVWLSGSLVAPLVWTVFLSLLLVVDFIDCRKRAHADLSLPERRKKDGRSLKLALAGLFFAWGLGVPAVTLIHQLSRPSLGKAQLEEMNFIEHAGFRCGEALVTACFFALGCNIGSFLNVVVWRMPLGKSIVYEKSRCPVCSTAIAGKDNIPIFGWLSLGGQCRACSTDISPRYPGVEAVTGCIFLLLYFVELISGGANLPLRGINHYRGVLWTIMYPKWDLISLYLFHCFLFSTLLVWALIAIDGNRVPRRLLVFAFSVALILPIVFPDLALVPSLSSLASSTQVNPLTLMDRAARGVAGTIGGLLIGMAAVRFIRQGKANFPAQQTLMSAMALIGAALGWQAAGCIAAGFVVVTLARRAMSETALPTNGHSTAQDFLLVAVLHHVIWRFLWTSATHLL